MFDGKTFNYKDLPFVFKKNGTAGAFCTRKRESNVIFLECC